ncbi:MAG: hypothetical protein KBF21_19385 [Thermoanaerobaculia bacterium]|nr:hypothetical protein [Thermoanaerobaculia bacterium]
MHSARPERFDLSRRLTSLAWHCWRLLTLRGDWKAMPDSAAFVWLALSVMFLGGLTEQLVRGHSLTQALVSTLLWLGVVLAVSSHRGPLDRRLVAALALLSIGIEALLILTVWLPAAEWPVAIWSGIAALRLLMEANGTGAEARR